MATKKNLAAPIPEPDQPDFDKERLSSSVLSIPLLERMGSGPRARKVAKKKATPQSTGNAQFDVIIDLNLLYPEGRAAARARVQQLVSEILQEKANEWGLTSSGQGIDEWKNSLSEQYLFGSFDKRFLEELIRRDRSGGIDGPPASIHRIWPDFEVKALVDRSICTVKADAAIKAFSSTGEGITWAVLDSGIDALHPHFDMHANLDLSCMPPLRHLDFTKGADNANNSALVDRFGHGTHVAGIIAGAMTASETEPAKRIDAITRLRDESGEVQERIRRPAQISGMAPKCKLLSLKVLDERGGGLASNLIAALEHIQQLNNHGRHLRVHGVNLSVGYSFDPEWFACGQSPLCVEVDRLVKSGVVVVVAAGNTGYGTAQSEFKGAVAAGIDLTINDPGNAEQAITVGSTHRDMPHVYGVSYFSSKGPTGDGRAKPDLVAPGEKIVSCDAAWRFDPVDEDPDAPSAAHRVAKTKHATALTAKIKSWTPPPVDGRARSRKQSSSVVARYREDSGTSMAAPHVSGVIAAFLSVRREFVGRPERVKELFTSTATDLRRERYFQGAGLVDLMRAIQSV